VTNQVVPIAAMVLSAVQTLLMLADELIYHRRRRLGVLESLGHPLDTAAFLAALAVPALRAPTDGGLMIYGALGLFSTLLITKDEWIHARECEPAEHWLHAVLFVLHAPLLFLVGWTWKTQPDARVLTLLPPLVGGWMAYQIVYWGVDHGKRALGRRGRRPAAVAAPAGGEQPLLR
jgi:hypothetical protein